jgi:hypothetical protein
MRTSLLLIGLIAIAFTSIGIASALTQTADISGTWVFSVDLEDGQHGAPTFFFKQEKGDLTGTYDGPLGQYKVNGTVKDNKVVFGFEFSNEGQTLKATYTGTIESSSKMTGTVEFSGGPHGKWTATRK